LLLSILCLPACQVPPTPTPVLTTPIPEKLPTDNPFEPPPDYVLYVSQSGDTLAAIAARFETQPEGIISSEGIPAQGLIDPGLRLYLPAYQGETTSAEIIIADSEFIFSDSATDFDMDSFVKSKGGKLSTYIEERTRGPMSGAQILSELAWDNSINPRLLLSLLEMSSGWVTGQPETLEEKNYPYHYINTTMGGIFKQSSWVILQLMDGYYGWRQGKITQLTFKDRSTLRLAPSLNAGTVGVMTYLSRAYPREEFAQKLAELSAVHADLFGDARQRSRLVEPIFPAGLQQPEMRLPFNPDETWLYTCGPHTSWGRRGQPLGALDFAPPVGRTGCGTSTKWVTASAPGLVIYAWNGRVLVDMEEDGNVHTGWVILYMHLATEGRVEVGTRLQVGERVGHPSCEGGYATGTHVHIARMYNGEWVLAEGGLPFILSGSIASSAEGFCAGRLTRLSDGWVNVASYVGSSRSRICQPESDKCTLYTPTPTFTRTPRKTATSMPTRTPRVTATPIISQTPLTTTTPTLTVQATPTP